MKKPLILYYITNSPQVALVAEKNGVDRIWIDLETLGKEKRQKNMDTVKSRHSVEDIRIIKPLLTKSELMVRVNPWNKDSIGEIEAVVDAGADVIMLPYWKSIKEVASFLDAVKNRCKTNLLLETREAVDIVDDVVRHGGFDEIHIGLNDLHLSYGLSFLFEVLANGTVDYLAEKFNAAHIPFGFGGIARLGNGLLPAERVIMEHYRLGSTRAILSRAFCDYTKIDDPDEIERLFAENMGKLREYELSLSQKTPEEFVANKSEVIGIVSEIVKKMGR